MDIDTNNQDEMKNVNVTALYLNHIGILHIQIKFERRIVNPYSFKVYQSCEDGLLRLKIKVDTERVFYLKFSIFIKSLKINFKDSILSNNEKSIFLKYYTNKDLFISEVKDKPFYSISSVNQLKCKCCLGRIISSEKGLKLFYKFNFNYVDSIDILSCHESHNNIHIEDRKLLSIVNQTEFSLDLFQDISSVSDVVNHLFSNQGKIYCSTCNMLLGKKKEYIINNASFIFNQMALSSILLNEIPFTLIAFLKHLVRHMIVNSDNNVLNKVSLRNENNYIFLEANVNHFFINKFNEVLFDNQQYDPNKYKEFSDYFMVKYSFSENISFGEGNEEFLLSDDDFKQLIILIINLANESNHIINEFILSKDKQGEEKYFLINL